ncbi:hypothetical protein D3C72_900160 [compost metagenome]
MRITFKAQGYGFGACTGTGRAQAGSSEVQFQCFATGWQRDVEVAAGGVHTGRAIHLHGVEPIDPELRQSAHVDGIVVFLGVLVVPDAVQLLIAGDQAQLRFQLLITVHQRL